MRTEKEPAHINLLAGRPEMHQKRSRLEERCGIGLEPAGFAYEAYKIPYAIEHMYTPDFSIVRGKGLLHVEVKGFFRPGDRQKYKAIAKAIVDSGNELVFLLQNGAKAVAKGAKLTMEGWCAKNGIRSFTVVNIDQLISYSIA